ncbi:MAG: tetratricopeptide repeat protein [Myxococcales bacterium]|jgi:tetratricopeptide (TPR) repeat protein
MVAPAWAQESLEGSWETPLGVIRLEQEGDRYAGKLVDPNRNCGFAKGSEVVRGRMVDGLFTGEFRVCYPAGCPRREDWALMMAALSADGDKLAGSLAPAGEECRDLVFNGRPFGLARQTAVPLAAEIVRKSEGQQRQRKMTPEAHRLYLEGGKHSRAGLFEAARFKFEAAARIDPHNPEILNKIGISYYALGNYKQAEKHYRRALAIDSDFTDAHYNLACVLAKQGKLKEALRSLRKAVDFGFGAVSDLDTDEDLKMLRDEPAYQQIRALAQRNHDKASR